MARGHGGARPGWRQCVYDEFLKPIMVGGDLIVAIDDQAVREQPDLTHIMNSHRAGDTVKVTFYRGKRKMTVQITLGEAREQV